MFRLLLSARAVFTTLTALLLLTQPAAIGPAVADAPQAADRPFALFWATHSQRGQDVWLTDGTPRGTRQLFNIGTGSARDAEVRVAVVGGRVLALVWANGLSRTPTGVYFVSRTGEPERLLPDRNLRQAFGIRPLRIIDGQLHFVVFTPTAPQLYRTDGTLEGTVWLSNANSLIDVFPLGNRMVMLTNTFTQQGSTYGRLLELVPGNLPRLIFNFPRDNGMLMGDYPETGAQTQPVVLVGPQSDRFVFWRDTPRHGIEPWVSDGTPEGTRMLRNIGPLETNGSGGQWEFLPFNGRALFIGLNNRHGDELWITDGTPEGTQMLRDINRGAAGSEVRFSQMVRIGDRLYFPAYVNAMDRQIWTTDGTPEGTQPVRLRFQRRPVTTAINGPRALAVIDESLYFVGQQRQGACPGTGCSIDYAIYQYNTQTERLRQRVRANEVECRGAGSSLYRGAGYRSLIGLADRLLFSASGQAPAPTPPACSTLVVDSEPWMLRRQNAGETTQIQPDARGSWPEYFGTSICDGLC